MKRAFFVLVGVVAGLFFPIIVAAQTPIMATSAEQEKIKPLVTVETKAREAVKAGKTPEQAMMEFQATLPAKFKDYNLAPGRGGPGGAFVVLFEELKQTTK